MMLESQNMSEVVKQESISSSSLDNSPPWDTYEDTVLR